MPDFRAQCAATLSETLTLLEQLAALESPSTEKAAVDACQRFVAERLRTFGAEVQTMPQTTTGDHTLATWRTGTDDSHQFLVLCHLDTVWPIGTLAHMPIHEADGKLYGPGIYDMKAGSAIVLTALRTIKEAGSTPKHPIQLLFTSDEEIGSVTSRALIESEARKSTLVLVMEPAMRGGQLKTFRKGVGQFNIVARGRSAHAGVDHEQGVNAIEELAHQIVRLQKMTDYAQGTTVNVGVIKGGTASNVVPERASMEVDFRVSKVAETDRIVSAIQNLTPALKGARLEISGGLNRPPMERTPLMVATFEQVRRLGESIGLKLEEGSTGGASDANFTAALGIPTLDGLGALGDGAHAAHEHIVIGSLADRAALLATIFTQWESHPQ
jgi:glutamate carboxypeptidase